MSRVEEAMIEAKYLRYGAALIETLLHWDILRKNVRESLHRHGVPYTHFLQDLAVIIKNTDKDEGEQSWVLIAPKRSSKDFVGGWLELRQWVELAIQEFNRSTGLNSENGQKPCVLKVLQKKQRLHLRLVIPVDEWRAINEQSEKSVMGPDLIARWLNAVFASTQGYASVTFQAKGRKHTVQWIEFSFPLIKKLPPKAYFNRYFQDGDFSDFSFFTKDPSKP